MNAERVMLVTFWTSHMTFLIPKNRGKGFMRSPVYHSSNKISRWLDDNGGYDCCGLDGWLEVEGMGYIGWEEQEPLEETLIKPFAGFLNCSYRIVNQDESLRNNPCTGPK